MPKANRGEKLPEGILLDKKEVKSEDIKDTAPEAGDWVENDGTLEFVKNEELFEKREMKRQELVLEELYLGEAKDRDTRVPKSKEESDSEVAQIIIASIGRTISEGEEFIGDKHFTSDSNIRGFVERVSLDNIL